VTVEIELMPDELIHVANRAVTRTTASATTAR
jgi:hypothetical protein